ncbi:MAG: hypothetical protein ACKO8V_07525, partial [Actinomycetota bacterium]
EVALRRDGVVAGDPASFDAADALADENTKRMMSAITNLLPPEAREHREPTEAELRAALPSNYKGDPNAELPAAPAPTNWPTWRCHPRALRSLIPW